jgi:hypothetical protein
MRGGRGYRSRLSAGVYCCGPLTGPGACDQAGGIGPCVCDSSATPVIPDDPIGGDDDRPWKTNLQGYRPRFRVALPWDPGWASSTSLIP